MVIYYICLKHRDYHPGPSGWAGFKDEPDKNNKKKHPEYPSILQIQIQTKRNGRLT